MRLTPAIAHAFDRVVPEGGDVICDTHLPGGTIVGISAVVVHQDKEIYGQDAHIYRPERWLEASKEQLKLMEKAFFTFGHGSRVCIGKNIGLTEVSKFVPRILRRFDIEWASDKPEWDMQMLWFTAQTGVVVRLTPRSIAEVKE
ncbi:cytochrome p450 oxidoreductase [Ilyonectria robusta]